MEVTVHSDAPISPNFARGDASGACAYPTIERLPANDLCIAYRSGSGKHSYDGVFVTQRSTDNGSTWGDPRTVFDGREREPVEALINGNIVTAPDGTLCAALTTLEVTAPESYMFNEDGARQARRHYLATSTDGGQVWSEPRRIEHFPSERFGFVGRSFVLPDRSILFSIGRHRPDGLGVWTGAFSEDDGRTIGEARDLLWDPKGKLNYDDPYFAVCSDGTVIGLFWTYRQADEATIEVHRSVSVDNGRSWSVPQPVGMLGQISVPVMLDNDTLLVASNYRRCNPGVRLWLSHDRGLSFSDHPPVVMWDATTNTLAARTLDGATGDGADSADGEDPGVWSELELFTFGTPGLVRLADDTILLTYYATIDDIIHVRGCRFSVRP